MDTRKKEQSKDPAKRLVESLVQILEAADFDEAQRAALALGEIADPAAIQALVALFKRSSAVRHSAIAALRKISKENDAAATELAIALLREKAEALGPEVPSNFTPPADRRRMPRVLLEIPVTVNWRGPHERAHTEPSTTQVVNAYGALVRLKSPVTVGLDVEITNLRTRAVAPARVAWVGSRAPG